MQAETVTVMEYCACEKVTEHWPWVSQKAGEPGGPGLIRWALQGPEPFQEREVGSLMGQWRGHVARTWWCGQRWPWSFTSAHPSAFPGAHPSSHPLPSAQQPPSPALLGAEAGPCCCPPECPYFPASWEMLRFNLASSTNIIIRYLVTQSCPTDCDTLDCSPPGFSVHGILQARILKWDAISYSRWSSQSRDQTSVSCVSVYPAVAGRFFTTSTTWEAPLQ